MTGIFISYSRKDSAHANKLIEEFKSIDLDVWVDWEDIPPAVGWLDQILRGIEEADAFVFLISPDSLASEVCNKELEHAHQNSKRIIPIVVRDVDPRTTEAVIRDLNWIFIREQDDHATGLDKVKTAINLDVDWLEEHRRLQVRALEWDRKKDPSLLLRGGDLRNARRMIAAAEHKNPTPSDLQKMYLEFSRRSERIRTITWISAAFAILVMVLLSLLALNQRNKAQAFAVEADTQRAKAVENAKRADDNARAALAQKAVAEKNEVVAEAQRSAARAQIFQSKAGGLFTSTLLAVDSWTRVQSSEAEGILRKNISLLPIPVRQINMGDSILNLEVSPDGATFAATSASGKACVFRFEDGGTVYCAESSGSVLDASFSPDGKVMVIGDSEGNVQILDAKSGQVLQTLSYGVPIRNVNISPNSHSLAIARDDGRITFINLSTYKFESELSIYGGLNVTAFSPDGEWFAAGSESGAVTFWNLTDGQIVSTSAHHGAVFDIAFSPDSRKLVSGGADNLAFITQPSTGKNFLKVTNEDWVEDVDFSPDGKWFVTASDDFRIRVWDTNSGEERLRLLQDSLISAVKVSPNGQWIASTGYDKTLRVWSAANGAEMYQVPLSAEGKVLDFSRDAAYLVAGDSGGNVSIWDISALKTSIGYLQFNGFVQDIKLSPNGNWLAASAGGGVWILNPDLYSTQTVPEGNPDITFANETVTQMAVNPDGTLLAVTTDAGRVILLNPADNKFKTLVENGAEQKVAFTPDGSSLIMGNYDGLVQYRGVTNTDNGTLFQVNSPVYSLSVSSNGLVAIGIADKVEVLDLATRQLVAELDAPGNNQVVEFNKDGSILASGSSQQHVYIWQNTNGQFTRVVDLAGEQAISLSFDPDNNNLFVGEEDIILVLDPLTGVEVQDRVRQKGAVTEMVFSGDGQTMITSSLKTVQFLNVTAMKDIPRDDLASAACSRVIQNFSLSEWQSFFGDEKYKTLCPNLPVPN